MSLPVSEKQGMVAAYLEDCDVLTAEEITAGYLALRQSGSAFPPSGPELRKHALNVRADRIAKERAAQPKLASPPRGIDAVPESERAAMKERIDALLSSWRQPEASQ